MRGRKPSAKKELTEQDKLILNKAIDQGWSVGYLGKFLGLSQKNWNELQYKNPRVRAFLLQSKLGHTLQRASIDESLWRL